METQDQMQLSHFQPDVLVFASGNKYIRGIFLIHTCLLTHREIARIFARAADQAEHVVQNDLL